MEANPGTAESEKFKAFRAAGVNRLSIGVQSFSDEKLQRLGRIQLLTMRVQPLIWRDSRLKTSIST